MLFVQGPAGGTAHQLMIDVDNCFIIVKNVPSQVCGQCGEVSYSDEVAAKLERIVKAVRKAVSEVAIVNYQDSVA